VILLLSLGLLTLTSARPQLDFGEDDEEYYDEGEYFYQEYEENGEDYGYYNYKDGSDDTNESDDYGISREEEPDPYPITTTTTTASTTRRTTTTTTTTTRRPYIPRTTRRTTTSTRMPSKRFMPGRTRNTNQQRRRVEQTTTPMIDLSKTVEPGLEDATTPAAYEEPNLDEYGNKLVYLGYRKEDYFCPEGYVLDIYGYCRAIFYEEKRDWRWWANIRNFILGGHNSGYQSSY